MHEHHQQRETPVQQQSQVPQKEEKLSQNEASSFLHGNGSGGAQGQDGPPATTIGFPDSYLQRMKYAQSAIVQNKKPLPTVASPSYLQRMKYAQSPIVQNKKPQKTIESPGYLLRKKYEEAAILQRKMSPIVPPSALQRKEMEDGQHEASSGGDGTPTAMSGEVLAKMEGAFGADFSSVKLHKDSSRANEMGALAFTQGEDVHFAPGQFDLRSHQGQALLGHELTHVVQQRAGRVQPTTQMKGIGVNDDAGLEKEADEWGEKVAGMPLLTQKTHGLTQFKNQKIGGLIQVQGAGVFAYADQECTDRLALLRMGVNLFVLGVFAESNSYLVVPATGNISAWSKVDMDIFVRITDFEGPQEHLEGAEVKDLVYPDMNMLNRPTNLHPAADIASPSKLLPKNTHVTLLSPPDQYDWVHIRVTETGEEGFIAKFSLIGGRDVPIGSSIHRIQGPKKGGIRVVGRNGDTLEKLIKTYYPKRAEYYADLRTIANVILEFNNVLNSTEGEGILVEKDGGFAEDFLQRHGANYWDIVIRADHDIVMPSWEYVLDNLHKVKSGSITEAVVESFWEEGFGVKFEANLGAGLLVFQAGVAGSISFQKKNGEIVVSVEGKVSGGVGVAAGAGIMLSGKKAKRGIGARAGAEAELNQRVFSMLEFRIPLRAGFILRFMEDLGKLAFADDKAKAAKKLLKEFFHGDPLFYLNKFKVGAGLEGHARAEGKAGIMTKGENVESKDMGGGEVSSHTNTSRTNSEDQVNGVGRKTVVGGIKDLLKTGKSDGLKEAGVWKLSSLIGELTNTALDAKVDVSAGLEYWKDRGGVDHVAMYVEGMAALEIGIPFVPNVSLGGKAAVKLVFHNIGTPQDKTFRFKGVEMAYGHGDLDDTASNASEVSMGIEFTDDENAGQRILNALHGVQIKKRMSIDLGYQKLNRALHALEGVDALVSSKRKQLGYILEASLLVELDFSKVILSKEALGAYETLFGVGPIRGMGLVSAIAEIVKVFLSHESLGEKAMEFMRIILQPGVLSALEMHLEAGIGGAFGGTVGAEVKVQVDVGAGFTLFYQVDLLDQAREALQSVEEGNLKRDILRGVPDILAGLVEKHILPDGTY